MDAAACAFVSSTPVSTAPSCPPAFKCQCSSKYSVSSMTMDNTNGSSSPNESHVSRRDFFKVSTAAISTISLLGLCETSKNSILPALAGTDDEGPFTLPALPYAYNGLEPRISEAIMRAHHDSHFATYVKNLNAALSYFPKSIKDDKSLIDLLSSLESSIPDDDVLRMKIRNNGGGYINHKLFFAELAPNPRPLTPNSPLSKEIEKRYGSVDQLKNTIISEALGLFGSGFTWLVKDDSGSLSIVKTANQDNPIMLGKNKAPTPILACDCWEHSWYYQYGPKKKDYFPQWWDSIDWPVIEKLYDNGLN